MQHQREIQWGAGNLDLEQKLEKGWTDEGIRVVGTPNLRLQLKPVREENTPAP